MMVVLLKTMESEGDALVGIEWSELSMDKPASRSTKVGPHYRYE
jgi:hypothetical protein